MTNLPMLKITKVSHRMQDLPQSLAGLRILHLSDLHLEETAAYIDSLLGVLSTLACDTVVVTGDIAEGRGAQAYASTFFRKLLAATSGPCLAVLGNHDRSGILDTLENSGVVVLLNGACLLGVGDERFWVAGVDDAHHYGCADLKRTTDCVQRGEFAILLAHSPDTAEAAAKVGYRLFLCGHTHGGQFASSRFGPLGYRLRYPRSRISGLWRHGDMIGYTSAGLSAHMGLVRIGCVPEIVIHALVTDSGG